MVVIEVGYNKFCLPRDKALQLVEMLEQAEVYEAKYWSQEKRKKAGMDDGTDYTYHVYPNEKSFEMRIISDDLYQTAKLAGKPEKE